MSAASYRILDTAHVPLYVAERPELGARLGRVISVAEAPGEGNINLVFIVRGETGSLVLKQGLPYVRIITSWPLSPDRTRHEALAYQRWSSFANHLVPDLYGFDAANYVLAMEDLSDHAMWRQALCNGDVYAEAAPAMGRLIARIAFHTSAFGVEQRELKARLAESVNPELCKIMEDLVFTEPYMEHEHNSYDPAIEPIVAALRQDPRVRDAVARLKYEYMSRAEALLHGDFHTGSVMVRNGSFRAMDTEFSYYGPIAYDLGLLWGNFLIALARARVLHRPAPVVEGIRGLLGASWRAFVEEFNALWPNRIDHTFTDGFRDRWLRGVLVDTLGFAGCEANRRVIGIGHVKDLEELEGEAKVAACGGILRASRAWIVDGERLAEADEAVAAADAAIGRQIG